MKSKWASKTIWLHTLSAGLATLELNTGLLQAFVTPKDYLLILIAVNMIGVLLRFATDKPIQ